MKFIPTSLAGAYIIDLAVRAGSPALYRSRTGVVTKKLPPFF